MDRSRSAKFQLNFSTISLDQAIITARQPITVKGDTIEYDADSFRTQADESLEDILKKLPGIEVENGKVFYEGKEIKTIKVGNREVLGGNTKLLTKNLNIWLLLTILMHFGILFILNLYFFSIIMIIWNITAFYFKNNKL